MHARSLASELLRSSLCPHICRKPDLHWGQRTTPRNARHGHQYYVCFGWSAASVQTHLIHIHLFPLQLLFLLINLLFQAADPLSPDIHTVQMQSHDLQVPILSPLSDGKKQWLHIPLPLLLFQMEVCILFRLMVLLLSPESLYGSLFRSLQALPCSQKYLYLQTNSY